MTICYSHHPVVGNVCKIVVHYKTVLVCLLLARNIPLSRLDSIVQNWPILMWLSLELLLRNISLVDYVDWTKPLLIIQLLPRLHDTELRDLATLYSLSLLLIITMILILRINMLFHHNFTLFQVNWLLFWYFHIAMIDKIRNLTSLSGRCQRCIL